MQTYRRPHQFYIADLDIQLQSMLNNTVYFISTFTKLLEIDK